ncbi:ABC transporter substrate-binding protein [Caldimonas sp.]|uniref:ABC transporter substrate-binding protein n=1 Tax=Caldimonas sp. TaxID=2838790 RepID=UPI00391A440C
MIEMQKLSKHFESANPDIKLKWVTLEEGVLRQRVTTDIATKGGQFDIMTIGMYEAPIWGKKGWLQELKTDASYDVDDLLPAIRSALTVGGKLYAAPFYGESSMLMYRKDLADKAGFQMPERPTWTQVAELARKIHNPPNTYGICLRGKPGWGDNMAFLSTLVNTHGGQWFDMQWKPQIDTKPWKDAITFYVDLLKNYGPPGSSANSFNEILALTNSGKCGMWVDATIAASFVSDPKQSKVAEHMAFAQAPVAVTPKGANWLWSWNLAIPAGSKKVDAAQKFITWATSKDYIQLVAKTNGWANVPTGTRKSTYAHTEFQKVARFAAAELKAIESADPTDATLPKSPYVGVQFAAIPEFQAIGIAVGQQMSAALSGRITVDAALKASQTAADREMRKAGYYK